MLTVSGVWEEYVRDRYTEGPQSSSPPRNSSTFGSEAYICQIDLDGLLNFRVAMAH